MCRYLNLLVFIDYFNIALKMPSNNLRTGNEIKTIIDFITFYSDVKCKKKTKKDLLIGFEVCWFL